MEYLKNINITISSGTIIKSILFVLLIGALFFLKDLILLFLSVFYFFAPPLLQEATNFSAFLSNYSDIFNISNKIGGSFINSLDIIEKNFSLKDALFSIQSSFTNISEGFIKTASIAFGGIISFVLIIIFSFYFAVQKKGIDNFL